MAHTEQQITQKYKTAVNQLTFRALVVGYAIGGLFACIGLSIISFSAPFYIILFGLGFLGIGVLIGGLGMVRAWQMRSWQLLLVQAKVLEKRKVTFRGTRYYLRLQPLQTEALDANGRSPLFQSLGSELDYMTSLSLFNQSQEGETAKFICVPRSKQIIDRI